MVFICWALYLPDDCAAYQQTPESLKLCACSAARCRSRLPCLRTTRVCRSTLPCCRPRWSTLLLRAVLGWSGPNCEAYAGLACFKQSPAAPSCRVPRSRLEVYPRTLYPESRSRVDCSDSETQTWTQQSVIQTWGFVWQDSGEGQWLLRLD